MQRLFDVLLSGFALMVLAPLLVPIAIVLRLTSEGEVFALSATALTDKPAPRMSTRKTKR